MRQYRIRVVLAKLGLDGHDRGIRVVARILRDAGMEVIYTGLWPTPGGVARIALEEDADVIGVSLLSGAHMTLLPKLLEAMKAEGCDDIPLILGGSIPDDDVPQLNRMGVAAVFGPGTPAQEIIQRVTDLAQTRASHEEHTGST
ncbi:MAG: cobalamin B12-binding domain-containing protein [Phycisphaeraceae bacterium]